MVGESSKIQDSFKIISLNPVTRAGDGKFMEILREHFADIQQRMQPVTGMPGVYTINPQPSQTLDSLNISSVI
jgi:hypothetical protein